MAVKGGKGGGGGWGWGSQLEPLGQANMGVNSRSTARNLMFPMYRYRLPCMEWICFEQTSGKLEGSTQSETIQIKLMRSCACPAQ